MKLSELKVINTNVDQAIQHILEIVEKQQKPPMIMMIGLPASGKSTFTSKLKTALEAKNEKMYTVASTDDLIDEAARTLGLNYTQAYATVDLGEIEKKFKQVIKNSIDSKNPFIIDRTNISKKNRHPHLVNTTSDFIKIAIAFEIDEKVQEMRLKVREREIGKHIPSDVIDSMRRDYEPPTSDEGFDEVIFIS